MAPVLLYTRTGCPYCDAKRAELAVRGVAVREVNVSDRPQAVAELMKLTGGRRIVPAITQLIMMQVDRGLDVETAFHLPRIDVSGTGPVRANWDLPEPVRNAIAARLPVEDVPNVVYPLNFANPSCIRRDPMTGTLTGMNEIMSPWAGGAAV